MQRVSGYVPGSEQWEALLRCWHAAVVRDRTASVLPYKILPATSSNSFEHQRAIADVEARLGVVLPRSYRDFHVAFSMTFGTAALLDPQKSRGTGFLNLSSIARLSDIEPEAVNIAKRFPIESPDDEYFIYGVKQSDASGRTRNLAGSILVGRHGSDGFERVVLYPQVRTADGEMEAALHYHSGEFRAPSFAELMRQLAYRETHRVEHVPPYRQAVLKGTCADLVPLQTWWE